MSRKAPIPEPSSPVCAQIPSKSRPSDLFSSLIVKACSKKSDRFDRGEATPFFLTAELVAATIVSLKRESVRNPALIEQPEVERSLKGTPHGQSFGVDCAGETPCAGMRNQAKVASVRAKIHRDGPLVHRSFEEPVISRQRFAKRDTREHRFALATFLGRRLGARPRRHVQRNRRSLRRRPSPRGRRRRARALEER
jgi:hypothetical protein